MPDDPFGFDDLGSLLPTAPSVAGAPTGSAAPEPGSRAVVMLFENANPDGVLNGPTRPTVFDLAHASRITALRTYHWNGGRGAPAGRIGLRRSDGEMFGPWPARAENRVYWVARPGTVLPAGRYTIVDSNPSTWSHDPRSNGAGMAWVEGHRPGAE